MLTIPKRDISPVPPTCRSNISKQKRAQTLKCYAHFCTNEALTFPILKNSKIFGGGAGEMIPNQNIGIRIAKGATFPTTKIEPKRGKNWFIGGRGSFFCLFFTFSTFLILMERSFNIFQRFILSKTNFLLRKKKVMDWKGEGKWEKIFNRLYNIVFWYCWKSLWRKFIVRRCNQL